MAAFLFSNHPKRERDREAHLNYYASAYNRARQLSHHKTKLNQIQQKLEMWTNAQPDGRPAKYMWHPLFNDAKFG